MTPITATLLPPAAIRLDFAFDKTVNEKLKTIPGWNFDGKAKIWTVPVCRLDALIASLGAALSLSYDVLQAKSDDEERRVRTFVANALAAGISLDVQHGRVIGSGGAYTALWQAAIDERAAIILSLHLAPATASTRRFVKPTQTANVDDAELTDFDRLAAAQWPAWKRNAAAETQQKQDARQRRRKGSKVAA
jgi:hypothetical protein